MAAGGARLLEGGPIADEIRTAVAEDVASFTTANGRPPGLAVVIVGRDAPSTVYLERILRGCAKVGIHAEFVELEGEATEASVVATIRDLNADPTVDGVIVQMPLPPTIRLRSVVDAIDPAKDIDGIHPMNAGLLRLGYDGFLPATAHAAVEILRRSGIEIEGQDAVVIGRSPVVGMPAAFLLVKEDATVTVCHSRTRDLAAHVRRADIVVVAAGRPGLVTGAMLKPGAVVVDVGINVVDGQDRRRRRLRIGGRGRLGDHPGPGRDRAAHQRAAADPPDPGRGTPEPRIAGPRLRSSSPPQPNRPPHSEETDELPVRPRDRPFGQAAPDHRRRPRPRDRRRRARAVRPDQGEGDARGDRPARGGASARQVRRRHRDHPDAAGRGQVDDLGRARPGPQRHRQEGRGQHPPAVARTGLRDQGRGGRRRLQPGHPDGGLQPPPDRRRPRHRGRAQPRRGVPRQQPPPQEPARHRPARDPLAARRRHQRPRAAPRRHRPRRARGRDPARDRVRHHRRLRGDGGPRPRHRPVRPARPARADRPGDDDRRGADHRRGPPRRRLDDGPPARRDQAEPAPDAGGRAGLRPRRAVRQHRPRQQLDHRRPARPGDQRHRRAPRRASGPTWAPRSSSTSSAGRPV